MPVDVFVNHTPSNLDYIISVSTQVPGVASIDVEVQRNTDGDTPSTYVCKRKSISHHGGVGDLNMLE